MPFHNLQQMSDALDSLITDKDKDSSNAAQFLVAEIQPLKTRLAAVEATNADLAAQLKALKGA